MAEISRLYTAESCDDSDPAPGVRLNCADITLNRLSADEARALAADLLASTGSTADDVYATLSGYWDGWEEPPRSMVAIRMDDAVLLLKVCVLYAPHLRDGQLTPDIREVVERVRNALAQEDARNA